MILTARSLILAILLAAGDAAAASPVDPPPQEKREAIRACLEHAGIVVSPDSGHLAALTGRQEAMAKKCFRDHGWDLPLGR